MIIDANTVNKLEDNNPDVIIVGAGSAGLVCAKEILNNKPNTKLTILESGGLDSNQNANHLDSDYSIDDRIDFSYTKARYVGGKSNLWQGRIMEHDEYDLKKWPINLDELNFWKKKALSILGIKNFNLKDDLEIKQKISNDPFKFLFNNIFDPKFTLWAKKTKRFHIDYLKDFLKTDNLRIYYNANVSELIQFENKITHIKINSNKLKNFFLSAKIFICCNGGIEIPRLLLSSKKENINGIANSNNIVGKNFTAHPRGGHGIIKLHSKINFANSILLNKSFYNENRISIGLKVKENIIDKLKMGNMLVYITPLDYTYHNKFYFLLRSKSYQSIFWEENSIKPLNFIKGFFYFFFNKLKEKFGFKKYTKYFYLRNYLSCSLNYKSQVYLSKSVDFYKNPKAVVDWQILDSDKETLFKFHKLLKNELEKNNLGTLINNIENKNQWKLWGGSSHFMSTTIMSKDKEFGTVDINCKAHDLKNLYLCGPSIFPEPSYSNPMLMIVAMSLRLGNYIAKDILK